MVVGEINYIILQVKRIETKMKKEMSIRGEWIFWELSKTLKGIIGKKKELETLS